MEEGLAERFLDLLRNVPVRHEIDNRSVDGISTSSDYPKDMLAMEGDAARVTRDRSLGKE